MRWKKGNGEVGIRSVREGRRVNGKWEVQRQKEEEEEQQKERRKQRGVVKENEEEGNRKWRGKKKRCGRGGGREVMLAG